MRKVYTAKSLPPGKNRPFDPNRHHFEGKVKSFPTAYIGVLGLKSCDNPAPEVQKSKKVKKVKKNQKKIVPTKT